MPEGGWVTATWARQCPADACVSVTRVGVEPLYSTTAARAFFLPHRSAAGPCFRSLDSNQGQQLSLAEQWRGCRGEGGSSKQESNAIRYTIGTYQRADDWIRTSMLPP